VTMTKFVTYPELPTYGVPAFSRKHFLDMQREGRFPKARQLSANRIAWLESEILDWIASRPVAEAVAGPANPTQAISYRRGRHRAPAHEDANVDEPARPRLVRRKD
jgi:predicted DNA-binding transcriptional regulator AlpA